MGRTIGSDAGVLLERDPDTVRDPDVAVAFISYRKSPRGVRNTRYAQAIPELVVAIRSPRDGASDLAEKALMRLGDFTSTAIALTGVGLRPWERGRPARNAALARGDTLILTFSHKGRRDPLTAIYT